MSSTREISKQISQNNNDAKKEQPLTRREKVIQRINAAKDSTKDAFPPPPQLMRQYAIIPDKTIKPVIYISPTTGALIANRGQYDMRHSRKMIELGQEPLTHMPRDRDSQGAFREELSLVSQAFFHRIFHREQVRHIKAATPMASSLVDLTAGYNKPPQP